ncbi:MAG TPA: 6-bladed beta-propeller [Gammaproteobacteria bacterium]|nr:6-bladed beta-propeller [Gammaproteobacteria bacterium]
MSKIKLFSLFLCASLLLACAAQNELLDDPDQAPFWPSLPDRPRFEYEFTLRSDLSIVKRGSFDKFKAVVTGEVEHPRIELIKPLDVASYNGRIIVSDSVMRLVYLFDIPLRLTAVFGFKGEGKLEKPLGVAIDGKVNFYVADAGSRSIVVYDSRGHYKTRIGKPGELVKPTDVAVNRDGTRIYVVDAGGLDSRQHHIVVYNDKGEKLFIIGERGTSAGKFNLPTHAAVAPDGTLYVLDTGNFRVQAFDANGKYLRSWGGLGTGYGHFARPRGIAVDNDGNIYVTDASFGNLQIFNPKGQLLMALGQGGVKDRMGVYSLIAGVSVDETGRIYIVDQNFQKVEVIKRLTKKEGEAIMQKFGVKPQAQY